MSLMFKFDKIASKGTKIIRKFDSLLQFLGLFFYVAQVGLDTANDQLHSSTSEPETSVLS